jgi:hypothetical protein
MVYEFSCFVNPTSNGGGGNLAHKTPPAFSTIEESMFSVTRDARLELDSELRDRISGIEGELGPSL